MLPRKFGREICLGRFSMGNSQCPTIFPRESQIPYRFRFLGKHDDMEQHPTWKVCYPRVQVSQGNCMSCQHSYYPYVLFLLGKQFESYIAFKYNISINLNLKFESKFLSHNTYTGTKIIFIIAADIISKLHIKVQPGHVQKRTGSKYPYQFLPKIYSYQQQLSVSKQICLDFTSPAHHSESK